MSSFIGSGIGFKAPGGCLSIIVFRACAHWHLHVAVGEVKGGVSAIGALAEVPVTRVEDVPRLAVRWVSSRFTARGRGRPAGAFIAQGRGEKMISS